MIKYIKVNQLSIEEMMKEFDLTREEVIGFTEETAERSTDMIAINGELYKEVE